MAESDQWDALLHWAKLVAESVDLDSGERDYKVALGADLARVREFVIADDPGWVERLKQALSPSRQNILSWRFVNSFLPVLDENQLTIRDASLAVWDHEPEVTRLDAFAEQFRKLPGKYSPGILVTFGSLLLMTMDAPQFPPFRPSPATEWPAIVGRTAPKSQAPTAERYEAFLDFLDEFIDRARSKQMEVRDRLDAQGLLWATTKWKALDLDPDEEWEPAQLQAFLAWRGEEPEEPGPETPTEQRAWLVHPHQGGQDLAPRRAGCVPVEALASTIMQDCLIGDGSLLTPGRPIWTKDNAAELHRVYVDAPDFSSGTFEEKLVVQLTELSNGARQLFAEIYILNLLPLTNFKADTKRKKVDGVLKGLDQPVAIPAVVEDAFAVGVFNGGRAFASRAWAQLSFLVEFVEYFKMQPTEVRTDLARDPIAMRQFVTDAPGQREPAQRRALLYLFHPSFYLPIVALEHRVQLRDCLADEYLPDGPTDDVDVDLRTIDDAVTAETGQQIDYYMEPWRSRWRESEKTPARTASKTSERVADEDAAQSDKEVRTYTIADIMADGAFVPRDVVQQILRRWLLKKNLILQGAPGTGKTWLARRLAYALIGSVSPEAVRAVQFHPNISYEDFVRGWRPGLDKSGSGTLTLMDGPLLEHAERARSQPDIPHVLVIEEINRGNPAQIFGEMLTLMESSKRDPKEALALSYPRHAEERYYLPENFYIIGTMNIADRSLALVDFALRRRFCFETLEPAFTVAWEEFVAKRLPNDVDLIPIIKSRISELNETLRHDRALGDAYVIGHSFVTPTETITNGKEWYEGVVRSEIRPLLAEYWYDNPELAQRATEALLA